MNKCRNENCDHYPVYGLAPHTHDLSITGSFIGSTVILPKEKWPENFEEDQSEPGMGVYHCPDCLWRKK